VTLLLPSGERRDFTISGTTEPRAGSNFGVSFVYWAFPAAQELLLQPGQATSMRCWRSRPPPSR
jgi:hypothetical protein